MTRETLTLFTILVSVATACSGAQLKKDWETQRGYPPEDVDKIMTQAKDYQRVVLAGEQESNALNTAPKTNSEAKMKAIFCACVKKLGDRCRQKPSGLSAQDKDLWIKANAVDMAYSMNETSLDTSPSRKLDPIECQ